MKREIKFRAWDTICNCYVTDNWKLYLNNGVSISDTWTAEGEIILEQYTGLKDKNEPIKTCIYEGDIVSLSGIVIGNIHENKKMAEVGTNLIIKGYGTRDWRATEKEAMDRGCAYT